MGYSKGIMKYSLKDRVLIISLWLFSALYVSIYFLRRGGYRFGIFKSVKAKLPVICVGNITAGGTGKTPVCILLAESLHSIGRKPAILSRGYKRLAGQGSEILVVSDWQKILANPVESGDEPFLMAKKLLGKAIVIVGKDRARASELATAAGADAIILDDGFQHWKLSRNLDIVLLDNRRPLDNGWLLPAGRLREPASALKRAGVIIATRCGDDSTRQRIERLIKKYNLIRPVFYCDHKAVKLKPVADYSINEAIKPTSDSKLFLFSGIARPDSFENSVKALGYIVSKHMIFEDHHSYNQTDMERISNAAKDCDAVITTEKDAVKLPGDWDPGKPLFVLEIEIAFQPGNGKEKLLEIVKEAIKR